MPDDMDEPANAKPAQLQPKRRRGASVKPSRVRVRGRRLEDVDRDKLSLAFIKLAGREAGVDLLAPRPRRKSQPLSDEQEAAIQVHARLAREAINELRERHEREKEALFARISNGALLSAPLESVLPAFVPPKFSSRDGVPSEAVLHAGGWHRLAQFCFQLCAQDAGRHGL